MGGIRGFLLGLLLFGVVGCGTAMAAPMTGPLSVPNPARPALAQPQPPYGPLRTVWAVPMGAVAVSPVWVAPAMVPLAVAPVVWATPVVAPLVVPMAVVPFPAMTWGVPVGVWIP